MTKGFSNFINIQTGEVVSLPSHYATLFAGTLELTDKDVECVDCNTPEPEVLEAAEQPSEEPFSAPVDVAITEPAKRTRRTSRNS